MGRLSSAHNIPPVTRERHLSLPTSSDIFGGALLGQDQRSPPAPPYPIVPQGPIGSYTGVDTIAIEFLNVHRTVKGPDLPPPPPAPGTRLNLHVRP